MDAKKIVAVLVQYSPHALLFSMISSFILVGYFESIRLIEHSLIISVAVAVTSQVIRLAAGLTSADFFRRKLYGKAILVLCFSLCLTIFETMHETIPEVLLLIWSGFFLELFLGMSLNDKSPSTPATGRDYN